MSLILEALKQSEGDRQDNSDAIGLTAYNQPVKQPKRWLVWLLGAILLLNIGVIIWYLFSSSAKPAITSNATNHAATIVDPVKSTPPAAPQAAAEPLSAGVTAAPVKTQKAVKNPLPTRPLSAEIGNTKKPAPNSALANEIAEPAITDSAPPQMPKAPTITAPPATAQPEKNNDQPADPTPKNTQPQPATPAPPGSDILRLADVADSVRIKLSAFEINAHVYSDVPENRFALINMKRFEEGDSLSGSGYKLIEILPTGLVIDYGQGRVLLPLPLNH